MRGTLFIWGLMGAVLLLFISLYATENDGRKLNSDTAGQTLTLEASPMPSVSVSVSNETCEHFAADLGPLPPTPVRDWFRSAYGDSCNHLDANGENGRVLFRTSFLTPANAGPTPDPWRIAHAQPTASPLTPSWRRHGSGSLLGTLDT